MATYAIGDIQGCFRSFLGLLHKLSFDFQHDRLWLVGDVVNRGPDSLEMLRWAKDHEASCDMVLGNHDLALLGLAAGVRRTKPLDTLDTVLQAKDAPDLLDWLRKRPLVVAGRHHLMLHAGVLPCWHESWLLNRVEDLHTQLSDEQQCARLLAAGLDKKRPCSEDLTNPDDPTLLRILTNLRALNAEGGPDLSFKGSMEMMQNHQRAWFADLDETLWPRRLVTGHWAALGLMHTPHLSALDSGCVWGGQLTALCLEDHRIIQQSTCELTPLAPDGDG